MCKDKKHTEFPADLIGQRIRELRKSASLTIEEIAEKINLSQSMISQIETGNAKPSLDTLWKLSYHLKVPIFSFFNDIESNSVVISKRENQKTLSMIHPNVFYRLLFPSAGKKLELMELQVQPYETAGLPLSHNGEECGYIIQGELQITIGDSSYTLEKGEGIYFDSTIPHKFYNPGKETAIGIWAMIN